MRIPGIRLLLVLLFVGGLGGCAAGIPEFGLYTEAFEVQLAQGNAVLDRFAAAERRLRVRVLAAEQAESPSFDPNDAALYVERTDPPIAAGIRQSLRLLHDYNLALAALASGETDRATVARFAGFATNLAATATTLQGLGAGAVAAPSLAAAGSRLAALVPAVGQLATLAGRAAFRRQFRETHATMRELLVTLRDFTPAMFDVMLQSYRRPDIVLAGSGLTPESEARLAEDRAALAGWVILIDQTLVAMDEAALAIEQGSAISSAGLLQASTDLRVLAERVRDATAPN
ncbi:MAG TPA: hypothetical protein VFR34_13040 [Paracoccaceae bacterium]|nr:hypothetical protein [Paracoccaceae bacterium]